MSFSVKNWNPGTLKTYLTTKHEEEKSGGYKKDERLWSFEVPQKGDKNKYVYKLRFLPVMDPKLGPLDHEVKTFGHSFKSPITGKWAGAKCPKTINKPCPICDYSGTLFNTGDPTDIATAKRFYRKLNYYANILVIKEADNASNAKTRKDNEGKVFLFKYGPKIHEKLNNVLFPPDGEDGVTYSDPVNGLDFNLIVKMEGDFVNVDSSEFVRTSRPIADNDDDFNAILSSVYRLDTELLAESNFQSFEDLEKLVAEKITGSAAKSEKKVPAKQKKEAVVEEEEDIPIFSGKGEVGEVIPTTKTPVKEEKTEDDDFLKQLEAELGNL